MSFSIMSLAFQQLLEECTIGTPGLPLHSRVPLGFSSCQKNVLLGHKNKAIRRLKLCFSSCQKNVLLGLEVKQKIPYIFPGFSSCQKNVLLGLQMQPVENKGFSYVPVCQLSKGIYLFKQKFHFLIRLLKAIRRITDQDSFKGTGLK